MRALRIAIVAATAGLLTGVVAVPAHALEFRVPRPAPPAATGQWDAISRDAQDDGHARVVVQLRTASSTGGLQAHIASARGNLDHDLAGTGYATVRTYATLPYVALDVGPDALDALRSSADVANVTRDEIHRVSDYDNLTTVQAPTAWGEGYDGTNEIVAVLDTGVYSTHPFLSGRVVGQACFASGDLNGDGKCPNGQISQTGTGAGEPCNLSILVDGKPSCSHGTHVAGIAAGKPNVSGAPPGGVARGAGILAVRVFTEFYDASDCLPDPAPCIGAYTADVIAGLQYVYSVRSSFAGKTIAAANMSLGRRAYTSQSSCDFWEASTKSAIDQLRAAGIATVVSSGNDGYVNAISEPACISSAVSVGSVDVPGGTDVSSFSNAASFLSLLAPGQWVTSSVPTNTYESWRGTSMAAPHVAGAFAVLRQRFPSMSVTDILFRLRATGTPVFDAGNGLTFPLLQVANALTGGPPSAPGSVYATAGDASATVSWAPASDNGAALSGYTITTSPGGATTSVDGSTTSTTIAGLANGLAYSFSVTATNAFGTSAPTTSNAVVPSVNSTAGYFVGTADGRVFSYGTAPSLNADIALALARPVVGIAATASSNGVWLVATDGGIFSYGDAAFFGSTGAIRLNQPIVGMATTPSGGGYWLVASDGGIFSFGDATFYGSTGAMVLAQPIVGMAATPNGDGYWLVAADGGIFAFGDATFAGSTGDRVLNQPIVGMAATPSGDGYWLVASDGGIFAFGDAPFYGSTGALRLAQPIVGMVPTGSGLGYWFIARDGGVFAFGDASFAGSATNMWAFVVGLAR